MNRFRTPAWVLRHALLGDPFVESLDHELDRVERGLRRFRPLGRPEASIVIPALDEQANLLKTLSSLSELRLGRSVELIVVDNGSTDRTRELLDRCGVFTVVEPRRGLRFARQSGLEAARGRVVLQADADSIYPPDWGDDFVRALDDPEVMMAYGQHAFVPATPRSRLLLGAHEILAQTLYDLRRSRREHMNVLGFNSALRRLDGLQLGSYEHSPRGTEDGHMAMTLMQYGRLRLVRGAASCVWTSDRSLRGDGSLLRALLVRLTLHVTRLPEYVAGRRRTDPRFDHEALETTSRLRGGPR